MKDGSPEVRPISSSSPGALTRTGGAAGRAQALGVHQRGGQGLETLLQGVEQGAHGVACAPGAMRSLTQA